MPQPVEVTVREGTAADVERIDELTTADFAADLSSLAIGTPRDPPVSMKQAAGQFVDLIDGR